MTTQELIDEVTDLLQDNKRRLIKPLTFRQILTNIITNRQAALVSGTNVKTINGTSILGSGDIEVVGGSALPTYDQAPVIIFEKEYSTAEHYEFEKLSITPNESLGFDDIVFEWYYNTSESFVGATLAGSNQIFTPERGTSLPSGTGTYYVNWKARRTNSNGDSPDAEGTWVKIFNLGSELAPNPSALPPVDFASGSLWQASSFSQVSAGFGGDLALRGQVDTARTGLSGSGFSNRVAISPTIGAKQCFMRTKHRNSFGIRLYDNKATGAVITTKASNTSAIVLEDFRTYTFSADSVFQIRPDHAQTVDFTTADFFEAWTSIREILNP